MSWIQQEMNSASADQVSHFGNADHDGMSAVDSSGATPTVASHSLGATVPGTADVPECELEVPPTLEQLASERQLNNVVLLDYAARDADDHFPLPLLLAKLLKDVKQGTASLEGGCVNFSFQKVTC